MTSLSSKAPNQDQWIETAARAGLIAKGAVYCLIGVLAFMAAFNLGGGNKGGKSQALQWIQDQTFGQILLALAAVGLLGYTIWRLVEAFLDTEHEGTDAKGIAKRARYLFSGLVYGALTYYAASLVLGNGSGGSASNGGGGSAQQTIVDKLLEQPFGQWLVGILAVGTIAAGIYQIYYALSDKYRKKVDDSGLGSDVKETLLKTGKVGYIARGIVWAVIGYLFLQAALQSDSSQAGGSGSAFDFLEKQSYGSWILGFVAIGLVCYGIFMFVRARHQPVSTR